MEVMVISWGCGTQVDFLYELLELDEAAVPSSDSDSPSGAPNELPERRAARGLFRWDVRTRNALPCSTRCLACKDHFQFQHHDFSAVEEEHSSWPYRTDRHTLG